MKNVSEWKFSAPAADVDLPRVMKEADQHHDARGVVKVTLPTGVVVLVDNVLRRAKFDLRRPDGYLTTTTKITPAGFVTGHESPNTFAPHGAIAVYRCATAQEADALVGKILDRVEVKVEVF